MKQIIICITAIILLTGCFNNRQINDTFYEKEIKYISPISECPYQNVYYSPYLRCDYYLDMNNLEKANGYYKIKDPTDVVMFKLTTSDNVKVYLNDLSEYIVVVK